MKIDKATRDALKKYLTGDSPDPAMTSITKRMLEVFLYADEMKDEFDALLEAVERGNPETLAKLVETKGELRTPDARAYVAARLRGKRKKPGNKLTVENTLRRIKLFMEVQGHMHIFQENQADALGRAVETRTSFVEKAFDIYAKANGDEEPSGEMREFLDQLSAEAESGLRNNFKKGRAEFREVLEALGFSAGPALLTKKTDGEK